jgi:hypothetical protein
MREAPPYGHRMGRALGALAIPDSFVSLSSRAEHARVNRGLLGIFRRAGARRQTRRLYEGRLPTWYLPAYEIWLTPHALPNRYRNALGAGDPDGQREITPSVQLNLALAPGSARPQARFVRDSSGRIWIGHSGTLGGRQPGISREAFTAFAGGASPVVLDDAQVRMIVLGTYSDPATLLDRIAQLVHAAHAYRSSLAAGFNSRE